MVFHLDSWQSPHSLLCFKSRNRWKKDPRSWSEGTYNETGSGKNGRFDFLIFPYFQAVLKRSRHAHSIIVTADRVAWKNGKICEKPTTKEQCHAYLNSYCHSYVELYSAICVFNSETEKRYTCCDVSRVEVVVQFPFWFKVCRYPHECSGLSDRKGRCLLLLWRNYCGRPQTTAVHYAHRWNGPRTPQLHSLFILCRWWVFLCNVSSMVSIWPVFLFLKKTIKQQTNKQPKTT